MLLNLISLSDGLEMIKTMIENAILLNGEKGKKGVINSSQTINVLHEVVKSDLVSKGVNPALIRPQLGTSSPEVQISGFLKFKTQDVCVFPNHIPPAPAKRY